ncbi:hypothetical protein JAAARDRAFT_189254 [Jaapia argillacea MUCL 33604]|uniref:Major royal jelly protein n=1 Tax=Jaapia argillacea MUCL 33604 TaxID=933084 RepID=A0A067QC15_9AGAM|nr:hypothetical protein JAAARDRAFT_189254 [Jaapia argillacea MUCL 33604]
MVFATSALLAFASLAAASGASRILDPRSSADNYAPIQVYDNGTSGPPIQLEHLFYNQWPTGLSVTSTGKIYANFPTQVNTTNTQFTVGVITNFTTEAAFPSVEYNTPPLGFLDPSNPLFGNGDPDHFISVQSVIVDELDRVWALDTGRPLYNGNNVYSSYGGAKLVGFDQNGTRIANIVLPQTVAYPDTLLNDVRFDLRPTTLPSGKGVAYITDSSDAGRNGIIVVDLGTGNAWRHLDSIAYTRGDQGFKSTYDGNVFTPAFGGVNSHITTGADGIALSADGEWLYFTPLSSRRVYRVPTSALLVEPSPSNPFAADQAIALTQFLGSGGGSHSDGLETDSSGMIYLGAPEQNGINIHNPETGTFETYVRDPRIQWPDTLSIATDNRLYFTTNQFWLQPALNNGVDKRIPPFGIFSVPIGAGKIQLT